MQQSKARLELANQTLKQQHTKELEGREEELEQLKVTLNKKLKSMSQQLDEVHEEKQAAVKVRVQTHGSGRACFRDVFHSQARRDLEREMLEYQSKLGDPDTEKKLKKQVRKYKALLEDTQEQLEHERESRGNSGLIKSLKNQLEELQASEATAVKNNKWLQGDMNELQGRYDDLLRQKNEVGMIIQFYLGQSPALRSLVVKFLCACLLLVGYNDCILLVVSTLLHPCIHMSCTIG